jgi:hypothetical protein
MTIIHSILSSDHSFYTLFFGGGGDYFRPITIVSFILDLYLFGENATAFHLVNAGIHITNSLLLFYLAYLLTNSDHSSPDTENKTPFIAALLFALHPVNSEAVMWIAARTDLLCCFFFVMALIVVADKRLSTVRSNFALFFLLLISLLAKESSVGMTAILLCWWGSTITTANNKRTGWLALSSFLSTATYMVMRSGVQIKTDAGVAKVMASSSATPLWQLCYDTIAAFGFYATKVIFPFPLNFAIVSINKPLSAFIFLICLVLLILLFIRIPNLRLPILIFTVCLVPPVMALHGKLPWTPYAERYLYLPMTGFALVCGHLANKLSYKLYLAVLTSILLLSVPTMQRVILWSEPMKFWTDVMQKSPEFPRSYVGVAYELLQEQKYDEAEPLLRKALSMGLNKNYVWQNLARIRLAKNDLYGYEMAMLNAAELSGNATSKYITLIQTVAKKSTDNAAQRRIIGYYLKAQQRDPQYGDGLYNAAKLYLTLGETDNALYYFRQFLQSPGDSMYQPFAKRFIEKIEHKNSTIPR